MNKNLYTTELKRSLKNLITWSLIVIGFTVMILAIYPYMADMGQDITQLMSKLPDELKKGLGVDDSTWGSILGFYNTYFGIYIIVLMGIYSASTGATIISKEEKDKTSEFLMTRPISRLTIFNSKIASLFTLVGIIFTLQTITAAIGMNSFSTVKIDWSTLATMHIHGFTLVIFFTSVGVLLSMFITPKKNFMGMVVGIVFGTYFIDAISKAADPINWLGYFSPFHYVGFNITDNDYSLSYFSIMGIFTISSILLIIAYKKYKLKDING